MRTLGLIGGLTYHATSLYYNQINEYVQKSLGNGHSAKIVLHSFDFADLIAHFHAKDYDEYTRQLIAAGKNLKLSGAEGLVLCVNTGHMFADELERGVGLELLHIIDYAGKAVRNAGLQKVALLGTQPVMEGNFMVGRLKDRFGVEIVLPEEDTRVKMNNIIFGDLASGLVTEDTRTLYIESVRNLAERGAQGIILACTELQMVLKEGDVDIPLFDTVQLHARGVAEWALAD